MKNLSGDCVEGRSHMSFKMGGDLGISEELSTTAQIPWCTI